MTRSYKTLPPSIPLLSSRSTQLEQKPLPPPPLIPQFPVRFTSAPPPSMPCVPKTRTTSVDHQNGMLLLQQQEEQQQEDIKRIGCNGSMSSPPQLIQSFDSGLLLPTKYVSSSRRRSACRTPPIPEGPHSLLTTPLSANITQRIQRITCSTERVRKTRNEMPAIVLKPITRRLCVTPASNQRPEFRDTTTITTTANTTTNNNRIGRAPFSGDDNCTPRRLFHSSHDSNSNNKIHGGAIPLSTSGGYSAFSVSSALPSLSTTIWSTPGANGAL